MSFYSSDRIGAVQLKLLHFQTLSSCRVNPKLLPWPYLVILYSFVMTSASFVLAGTPEQCSEQACAF